MAYNGQTAIKAREILRPPAPARVAWPKWLEPRIKDAIKRGKLPHRDIFLDSAAVVKYAKDCLGESWSDHLETIVQDGHHILVSYPYAEKIDLKMLQELTAFCDALDLKFQFSANSHYYPGRTVAIYLSPDVFPSDWPPTD